MKFDMISVFRKLQTPAIIFCLIFLGSNLEAPEFATNSMIYRGVTAASTRTSRLLADFEPDSDAPAPSDSPAASPESYAFDDPNLSDSPVITFASAPGMPPLSGGLPKCDGVLVVYIAVSVKPIPYSGDNTAYMFESSLNIFNVGRTTLHGWKVAIGFTHGEIIQEVTGASLPSGTTLPASGNGLLFGNPADLPYITPAYVNGGNVTSFGHTLAIYGTEFGANDTSVLAPTSIDIHAPGFKCKTLNLTLQEDPSEIVLCCASTGGLTPKTAKPIPPSVISRKHAGLNIRWDVLSSDDYSYQVMVRVENAQRYAAISDDPGWELQWRWQMGELIMACDGCQTLLKGNCLTCATCGDDKNASLAYSCDPEPKVVDGTGANGSLAALAYKPKESKTQFTMSLHKGKDFWGAARLDFPANFSVMRPKFTCDPPQQQAITSFPSATGSRQMVPALASYEVSCGPNEAEVMYECCVSASAFYNDTVSLCDSCTCGCHRDDALVSDGGHCNPHAAASNTTAAQALLGIDYQNKTVIGLESGRCPSNCGVEIHLSLSGGGDDGWALQAAIANRHTTTLKEWTAVFEFAEGMASSLNTTYSVNASLDTAPGYRDNLLLEGIKYYNSYLPGDQNIEFLMLFNRTVGSAAYNLTGGVNTKFNELVFPKSVLFNGKKCKMPAYLPLNITTSGSIVLVIPFSKLQLASFVGILRWVIVPCLLPIILW